MKSKFIESLKKLSQSTVSPLGFGRRKEERQSRPMLIISSLSSLSEGKDATLISDLDAILFSGTKINKESIKEGMKSCPIPWGIKLKQGADIVALKEFGFDFLVFSSEETEASVLRTEELGKVLEIDMNLPDSQLKSLEFLPVDVLLLPFPGKGTVLTVQDLMAYKRMDLLVTKPLLGYIPAKMSGEDLRLLWEAGLDGAILKSEEITKEELERIKEAIKSFPSQRGDRKKGEGLVPSLAQTTLEQAGEEAE